MKAREGKRGEKNKEIVESARDRGVRKLSNFFFFLKNQEESKK